MLLLKWSLSTHELSLSCSFREDNFKLYKAIYTLGARFGSLTKCQNCWDAFFFSLPTPSPLPLVAVGQPWKYCSWIKECGNVVVIKGELVTFDNCKRLKKLIGVGDAREIIYTISVCDWSVFVCVVDAREIIYTNSVCDWSVFGRVVFGRVYMTVSKLARQWFNLIHLKKKKNIVYRQQNCMYSSLKPFNRFLVNGGVIWSSILI